MVSVIVGQKDVVGAQGGFIERWTGVDEVVGRTLSGIVGIHLNDGATWALETETALAEPVDADGAGGYDEIFERVHDSVS